MFSRGIQQGSKPTRMPCEVIPLKPKAFLGPRSGVRKDRSDRREWLRCNSEVAGFLLVSNNSLATSFPWKYFHLWRNSKHAHSTDRFKVRARRAGNNWRC
jgi:hypothetical protein